MPYTPSVDLSFPAPNETDPDLDPLRDDPRFGKIIADAKKRLRLPVASEQARPVKGETAT